MFRWFFYDWLLADMFWAAALCFIALIMKYFFKKDWKLLSLFFTVLIVIIHILTKLVFGWMITNIYLQ